MEITGLFHSTIYYNYIYNIYIKIVHLALLGSGGFVAFFLAFSTKTRFVIFISEEAGPGHRVPAG